MTSLQRLLSVPLIVAATVAGGGATLAHANPTGSPVDVEMPGGSYCLVTFSPNLQPLLMGPHAHLVDEIHDFLADYPAECREGRGDANRLIQDARAIEAKRTAGDDAATGLVLGVLILAAVIAVFVAIGKAIEAAVRNAKAAPKAPQPPSELDLLRAKVAELEARLTGHDEIRATLAQTVLEQGATIERLNAQLQAAQSATAGATPGQPQGSFGKLKALVVHAIHPDHAPAGSVERAIREAMFKALWPQIEALGK